MNRPERWRLHNEYWTCFWTGGSLAASVSDHLGVAMIYLVCAFFSWQESKVKS